MKFTVKTIMVATFLGLLFAPVQAAELDSGFLDTKWSTPVRDLKGGIRGGLSVEQLSGFYRHRSSAGVAEK